MKIHCVNLKDDSYTGLRKQEIFKITYLNLNLHKLREYMKRGYIKINLISKLKAEMVSKENSKTKTGIQQKYHRQNQRKFVNIKAMYLKGPIKINKLLASQMISKKNKISVANIYSYYYKSQRYYKEN